MQQAADEGLLGIGAGNLFQDQPAGGGADQRPFPELLEIKPLAALSTLHGQKGKAQHQTADRVDAEDGHRLVDGGDLLRKAVKRGIGHPQNLRRQPHVLGNQPGNVGEGCFFPGGDGENLRGDEGEGGQFPGGENSVQRFFRRPFHAGTWRGARWERMACTGLDPAGSRMFLFQAMY